MTEGNKDYYAQLGATRNATRWQIQNAFLEKVRQCHPDLHPAMSDERYLEVAKAYLVLSDTQIRSIYDKGSLKTLIVNSINTKLEESWKNKTYVNIAVSFGVFDKTVQAAIPPFPQNIQTRPVTEEFLERTFNTLTHGVDPQRWPVKNKEELKRLITARGGLVPDVPQDGNPWERISQEAYKDVVGSVINVPKAERRPITPDTIAWQALVRYYFGLDGRQAEGVRANNNPTPAAAPVAAPTVVEAEARPAAAEVRPAATSTPAVEAPAAPVSPAPAPAPAPSPPAAAAAVAEEVPLYPPFFASPERMARMLGSFNRNKGRFGICEQDWLRAFELLGGVPDFEEWLGKDNWIRLQQGHDMPEEEDKIVNLIRSTLEAGRAGRAGTSIDKPEPPAPAAATPPASTVVAAPAAVAAPAPAPTPAPAATGAFTNSVALGDGSPSSPGTTRSGERTGTGLAGTAAAAVAAVALTGAVAATAVPSYQPSPSSPPPAPAHVAAINPSSSTSPPGIANTPPPAAPALTASAQPSLSEQSTAARPDFQPVVQAFTNLLGTTAHGIVSTGWSAVCSMIDPSCGGGQAFDITCKQVFDATKATGEALYSFFQETRQYQAQRNGQLAYAARAR